MSARQLIRRIMPWSGRLAAGGRRLARTRVIVDRHVRLGDFANQITGYATDLVKEEVARAHILERTGSGMRFLDVGGRDGELTYLLGIRRNLEFDAAFYGENKRRFDAKYEYFAVDLVPQGTNVLAGDICDVRFLENYGAARGTFDVVYSNNVFEHLERPWIAASHLYELLKPGGIAVTIVPFSARYHESPGDHFRYTHTGIGKLFSACGPIRELVAGYDTTGRRNNWQGQGEHNDICPVDAFGAWRENWFAVAVVEKKT